VGHANWHDHDGPRCPVDSGNRVGRPVLTARPGELLRSGHLPVVIPFEYESPSECTANSVNPVSRLHRTGDFEAPTSVLGRRILRQAGNFTRAKTAFVRSHPQRRSVTPTACTAASTR
jgi:hypothetical protein